MAPAGLTPEWLAKLRAQVPGPEESDEEPVVAAQDAEPAKMAPKPKRSRKKAIYEGRQSVRARAVLERMFPPYGICPTRAELPDVDLFAGFKSEYDSVEGQQSSRLTIPSDSV